MRLREGGLPEDLPCSSCPMHGAAAANSMDQPCETGDEEKRPRRH